MQEPLRRPLILLALLGLFFTFRGYHSREGDQAYRLPILLHLQNSARYATDPFVRAFDDFNPHRGILTLIDAVSRPFGLSASLAILFIATFFLTATGLDRLARSVWPDRPPSVGLLAFSLVLIAQAGNIGTNHLFEPLLLDRLLAFSLGWLAFSFAISSPRRGILASSITLGLACLIHPSVGLQLSMLLAGSWLGWFLLIRDEELSPRTTLLSLLILASAIAPGLLLNLAHSDKLLNGLDPDRMRLLSASLQSPQHMLPHLWRLPQWLAFASYPLLAILSLISSRSAPPPLARKRLIITLALTLLGLALAWYGIEHLAHLRLTLFQPFRMATIARGLCLVFLSGHLLQLWQREAFFPRLRASLLLVSFTGDWSLVVATLFEVASLASEALRFRFPRLAPLTVLTLGLIFLSRHDTESGHIPLLAVIFALVFLTLALPHFNSPNRPITSHRFALRLLLCWLVPLSALAANFLPDSLQNRLTVALIRRCRFTEQPLDDIERLALWSRTHTPPSARFIAPPGQKTFRLWSRRSLAFNRAGSPYQAAALADWYERYRDHVAFEGTPEAFVAAYLLDKRALEKSYDTLSPVQKAALAERQGADYIVASAPSGSTAQRPDHPLTLLRVEGRYAVYQVNPASKIASSRKNISTKR